jgi:hypothetical protein
MQALNDYGYNHGHAKILNAFLLLSESDGSDPRLQIGLDLLEGAFSAVLGEFGPVGKIAATLLSGLVSSWADQTPPNLNAQFASMLTRFEATSRAVAQQLATYYQDVAGNWNTAFTWNDKTVTVGSHSQITFPAETSTDFLHSTIGFVTPNDMLAGRERDIWRERDRKLEQPRSTAPGASGIMTAPDRRAQPEAPVRDPLTGSQAPEVVGAGTPLHPPAAPVSSIPFVP